MAFQDQPTGITKELSDLIASTIEKTNQSLIANLTATFDKSVKQIKRAQEEANEAQTREIKKIKTSEKTFKKKGNEIQHNFNSKIEDILDETKEAIKGKNTAKALEALEQGSKLIRERQKLILLADKSEFGWKTAAEYEEYLFRPISKTSLGYRLVRDGKPISYTTLREAFKNAFKHIVDDIDLYSTHSLRAGGATAAANSGIKERIFQRHGRWKSSSAKDGYIVDNILTRGEVSKKLGL